MERWVRLLILMLGTWVLWQAVEWQGQLSWRHRRTFADQPSAGLSAEQWCGGVRQHLVGHGTYRCLPEGTLPGNLKHPRLREPRP
jgi:hypothetical protein